MPFGQKERAIYLKKERAVGSIYLRLKSTSTMATILEVREDIKVLKQEIVALNKKIVASETKLEKLNQQKNEHGLSTAAKKEIGDEITFIRSDILLDKQLITAKEQRIVLEKRQIAAKEQKEAWNALWTAVTALAGLFIRWPVQFTANYPGLSNALSLFLHLTAACIAVADGLVGFLVNLVSRFWPGDAANEDNRGQEELTKTNKAR